MRAQNLTVESSDMPGDTLLKLQEARNYNRWVFDLCRPYLGQRLLEIGCGVGNLTEWFHGAAPLLATDREQRWLSRVQQRWPQDRRVLTACWDVTEPAPPAVRLFRPDTILCINMLEHVREDRRVLDHCFDLLPSGGRLIVYVPALPRLYGTLDEELHHFRRYGKRAWKELARSAGFRAEALNYVNFPGIFGWWLNGRFWKRRTFSLRQVRLYDQLIPLIAWLEKRMRPWLGQSLFYVGRKP